MPHPNHELGTSIGAKKSDLSKRTGIAIAEKVVQGKVPPHEMAAYLPVMEAFNTAHEHIQGAGTAHHVGMYDEAAKSMDNADQQYKNAWMSSRDSLGENHRLTNLLKSHVDIQLNHTKMYRAGMGFANEVLERNATNRRFEEIMKNENLGRQFD
jgi:hypothetical protein